MKFIHTRVLAGHQRIKRYTIALPGTKAFHQLAERFGEVKQKYSIMNYSLTFGQTLACLPIGREGQTKAISVRNLTLLKIYFD